MEDALADLLSLCRPVIQDLGVSLLSESDQRIEQILVRAKLVATILYELVYQYDLPPNITENVQFIANYLMEKIESLASGSKTTVQNCLKEHSGEPGRPKFIVSQAQVEGLRAIGMNWTEIASLLGISVRTLWDKRQLFQNFMDMEFNDLSNDELDGVVAEIIRISPSSGETVVAGALRSRGIKVQRWRMRDSMKRVDPIGKIARKLFLVRRRIYSVRSPNALWHIDSHHKLIRVLTLIPKSDAISVQFIPIALRPSTCAWLTINFGRPGSPECSFKQFCTVVLLPDAKDSIFSMR
eukprot:gene5725-6425_t